MATPTPFDDNKITNIIGTRIPLWVLYQLQTRSKRLSSDSRNIRDVLQIANKTGWVRLVSSVDLSKEDEKYFQINTPTVIQKSEDLAKSYILFGGTSVYKAKTSNEKYSSMQLRSGIGAEGSYGMLGDNEVETHGYRPMPGITDVTIETQGRLGSVRAANINFKCWDKNQLDIIDALYFKLGFSMILEWGNTMYYKKDNAKLHYSEDYLLDPFQKDLTKEAILEQIASSNRKSEGNYDGMVGMVTNFNFSYNNAGGFDCSLKLIGIGVLGDRIKINNTGVLPGLLKEEIRAYEETLKKAAYIEWKKNQPQVITTTTGGNTNTSGATKEPPFTYANIIKDNEKAADFKLVYPSDVFVTLFNSDKSKADAQFIFGKETEYTSPTATRGGSSKNTTSVGETVFGLTRLNSIISIFNDTGGNTNSTLDTKIILDWQKFKDYNNERQVNVTQVKKVTVNGRETTVKEKNKISERLSFYDALQIVEKDPNGQEIEFLDDNFTGLALGWRNPTISPFYEYKGQFQSPSNANYYGIDLKFNDDAELDPASVTSITTTSGQTTALGNPSFLPQTLQLKFESSDIKKVIEELDAYLITEPELLLDSIGTGTSVVPPTAVRNGIPYGFQVKFKLKIKKENQTIKFSNKNDKFGNPVSFPDVTGQTIFYTTDVILKFDDSFLIKSVVPGKFKQPDDAVKSQQAIAAQNQNQGAGGAPTTTTQVKFVGPAPLTDEQINQAVASQSFLELALKTIQLHTINKFTKGTSSTTVKSIKTLDLTDPKDASGGTPFIKQIFDNGIFSQFILDLTEKDLASLKNPGKKINTALQNYLKSNNPSTSDRLIAQSAFGFATIMMKNKLSLDEIDPNFPSPSKNIIEPIIFQNILKSIIVPYEMNQEVVKGTKINHPVYIPLGLLLMLLNHSCTIYDSNTDFSNQRPLVYIDFNPNHNFCLSNINQLSTNPWKVLIPYEGKLDNYKELFFPAVLAGDSLKASTKAKSKSKLFKAGAQDDKISGGLPPYRVDSVNSSDTSSYRGQIMHILLNIDYLVDIIGDFSTKDENNGVYLKPFMDQLLDDINKYLGNINLLRFSYNDTSNTYQIVDDQLVPPPTSNEKTISTKNKGIENTARLPLFGKESIAKSLQIKTDMGTKLANMIAISANASIEEKSTLSVNGDNIGYINSLFKDRYIPNRSEITASNKKDPGSDDAIIGAANQFNTTIKEFYGSTTPSEDNVSQATNYYIEKMSKIKNNDYATRASAMIPLSVEFTTDGISGLSMGQAFTIPDELLPYTYTDKRKVPARGLNSGGTRVGFILVGLSHTISENVWNTSVRANMTFLKDINEYSSTAPTTPATVQIGGGLYEGDVEVGDVYNSTITAAPKTFEELTAIIIEKIEGGYFHPSMFEDGRLAATEKHLFIFKTSGETMFGMDRKNNTSFTNSPEGKEFWSIIDSYNPNSGANKWSNEYGLEDQPDVKKKLINLLIKHTKEEFEQDLRRYVKNENFRKLIPTDARLYFNFIRASFNGSGWFQKFGAAMTADYEAGMTDTTELTKRFIYYRLNPAIVWPPDSYMGNLGYTLIRRGGNKTAKLVGVEVIGLPSEKLPNKK